MKKNILIPAIIITLIAIGCLVKIFGNNAGKIGEQLRNDMVVVEDGKISEENEGKIVLIKGKLYTPEGSSVTDDEFNVSYSEDGIFLKRNVEQYVYDGDGTKTLTYNWLTKYDVDDEVSIINDDGEEKLYYNPEFEIKEGVFVPESIQFGDFIIDGSIVTRGSLTDEVEGKDYTNLKPLDFANAATEKYNKVFAINTEGSHQYYQTGKSLGDYRIWYTYATSEEVGQVTILAKQEGNKLVEETIDKEKIFNIYKGNKSVDEVIELKEDAIGRGKVLFIIILIIDAFAGFCLYKQWETEKKK